VPKPAARVSISGSVTGKVRVRLSAVVVRQLQNACTLSASEVFQVKHKEGTFSIEFHARFLRVSESLRIVTKEV
jgi:hypothetical protein